MTNLVNFIFFQKIGSLDKLLSKLSYFAKLKTKNELFMNSIFLKNLYFISLWKSQRLTNSVKFDSYGYNRLIWRTLNYVEEFLFLLRFQPS